MTRDEQIAALQQKIAEIDAQIAQLQAARSQSTDPSERGRLDAQIASLQETRQALEDALTNLQSSPDAFALAAGVTPAGARRMVTAYRKAAVKDLQIAASNANKRAKELLKAVKAPKAKKTPNAPQKK